MKYNLYGYSQQKAIELGLDDRDLMILRWFIDYKDTGKMAKKIINDDVYYWIKYEGIVDAFPIAGWKKDTVYRRLKKLVNAKVLKHETIKQCGVWSYYTIGENYIELLDSNGKSSVILNKHRYTVLRKDGGEKVVNIRPNCHYQFHYLLRKSGDLDE